MAEFRAYTIDIRQGNSYLLVIGDSYAGNPSHGQPPVAVAGGW